MRLMTVDDVANYFNCSARTIWRKVKAGLLPEPHQIGKQRRWYLSQIQDWATRSESYIRSSAAITQCNRLLDRLGGEHDDTKQEIRGQLQLLASLNGVGQ